MVHCGLYRGFKSNQKEMFYGSLYHRKVVCKNKSPRDEKVFSLDKVISFLILFQDRRTDIVAYRGALINQTECPMVIDLCLWFIGSKESYMQKIKVVTDEKVLCLLNNFRNRQTDNVASRGDVQCTYAIKRDLLS